MALHERDTVPRDDSSQASSKDAGSIKSYSETDSLLSPVTAASTPNYKSTATFPDVESAQNDQVQDETTGKVTKSAAIIISLLLIGVFISYADGTLVLATYGTIASEFRALGDASWLTTSYSLAMCAVQPLTGKISDIYGRKPVLLISYGFFVIGCVLTGLSQTMWQTVMGRVVAGIGGAGMSVMVSVLIVDLVPLIHVAAWRSYVNVVGTIGRSIGGPSGGLLADTIGWRWSFIGQGPLMLFAIALPIQAKDGPSKLRRIDFVGAFLLTGTIAAFLGSLSLGGQALPWSHPTVLGLLLGSVVLGAIFVGYEVKVAAEPIFPPALAVQRDVATSYAINALQLSAQVGMMYSVPLYFRVTQGSSNTTAGLHLFPAVFGNTTGGLLAGWLITRTGHYKYLLTFSTISSVFSYTMLPTTWHSNHLSLAASLSIFPGGFGLGITAACAFIALTVSVQKREMGMATAGMYLMSSIGMVVGVALCAGVQNSSLGEALAGLELDATIVRQVMEDVGSVKDLPGDIKVQVIDAYVKSLGASHAVSVGLSSLAFLLSLVVRERKIRKMEIRRW
ncbi:uncharacterized protein EAE97_003457 [Botrytis byssoidea]|uniref:Major facilitator superfamily (MFS) profile domain-containing protein n=1 Tax=Botrytis byssoidea TaxID=139641 RepID=A0A9P5IT70_9HELO|nr:uncharacterized protein EAE97_003457 [Botrytis byssoidea]KAF7949948.1 hypothetical protein EAE97_003457 [Botrytis byssoidea]